MLNSRHRLVTATFLGFQSKSVHLMKAHLLPKLRCQFAEFLRLGSLKRLGILTPPTCVGLRYGLLSCSLRGFSWKPGITDFRFALLQTTSSLLGLNGETFGFVSPQPTSLNHHPLGGSATLLRPRLDQRLIRGTGILTCFLSSTP